MSRFYHIKTEEIVSRYFRLGEHSYDDKIDFYESHRQDLEYIEEDHFIHINLDYVLCLFYNEEYHKFVDHVDSAIELVIDKNVKYFKDLNIFNVLLHQKATALHKLNRFQEALPLLVELLRLDPLNERTPYHYYISKRSKKTKLEKWGILFSLVTIGLGLSLELSAMLSNSLSDISNNSSLFFISGGLLLIGIDMVRRYQIDQEIKQIQRRK